MKIRLMSDLHLEAAPYKYEPMDEDILILAGDIGEGLRGWIWANNNVPGHIETFIVPGNHEYYGQNVTALQKKMRECFGHVKYLLNDSVQFGNINIVGSTLWTDFNVYGNAPQHGLAWSRGLNDSVYINVDGRRLTANDVQAWNQMDLAYINSASVEGMTNVLVTHYIPENAVIARWKGHPLTPGFATKIPQHIHEKFQYHLFGHTHDSVDYYEPYGTHCICNPRGYSVENSAGFRHDLILEIE